MLEEAAPTAEWLPMSVIIVGAIIVVPLVLLVANVFGFARTEDPKPLT